MEQTSEHSMPESVPGLRAWGSGTTQYNSRAEQVAGQISSMKAQLSKLSSFIHGMQHRSAQLNASLDRSRFLLSRGLPETIAGSSENSGTKGGTRGAGSAGPAATAKVAQATPLETVQYSHIRLNVAPQGNGKEPHPFELGSPTSTVKYVALGRSGGPTAADQPADQCAHADAGSRTGMHNLRYGTATTGAVATKAAPAPAAAGAAKAIAPPAGDDQDTPRYSQNLAQGQQQDGAATPSGLKAPPSTPMADAARSAEGLEAFGTADSRPRTPTSTPRLGLARTTMSPFMNQLGSAALTDMLSSPTRASLTAVAAAAAAAGQDPGHGHGAAAQHHFIGKPRPGSAAAAALAAATASMREAGPRPSGDSLGGASDSFSPEASPRPMPLPGQGGLLTPESSTDAIRAHPLLSQQRPGGASGTLSVASSLDAAQVHPWPPPPLLSAQSSMDAARVHPWPFSPSLPAADSMLSTASSMDAARVHPWPGSTDAWVSAASGLGGQHVSPWPRSGGPEGDPLDLNLDPDSYDMTTDTDYMAAEAPEPPGGYAAAVAALGDGGLGLMSAVNGSGDAMPDTGCVCSPGAVLVSGGSSGLLRSPRVHTTEATGREAPVWEASDEQEEPAAGAEPPGEAEEPEGEEEAAGLASLGGSGDAGLPLDEVAAPSYSLEPEFMYKAVAAAAEGGLSDEEGLEGEGEEEGCDGGSADHARRHRRRKTAPEDAGGPTGDFTFTPNSSTNSLPVTWEEVVAAAAAGQIPGASGGSAGAGSQGQAAAGGGRQPWLRDVTSAAAAPSSQGVGRSGGRTPTNTPAGVGSPCTGTLAPQSPTSSVSGGSPLPSALQRTPSPTRQQQQRSTSPSRAPPSPSSTTPMGALRRRAGALAVIPPTSPASSSLPSPAPMSPLRSPYRHPQPYPSPGGMYHAPTPRSMHVLEKALAMTVTSNLFGSDDEDDY